MKKSDGLPFEALSKTKASLFATLSTRKQREKRELFTVEGTKCIADTLGGFHLEALIVDGGKANNNHGVGELIATCEDSGHSDRIFTAPESVLRKISTLTSLPTAIAVYRLPGRIFHDIPPSLRPDLYLMLDGVQDPGNLGTIIRTAHWFGITRIFASPETADPFNPKTVQASMGSLSAVTVEYCDLPALAAANPKIPLCGLLLEGKNIFATELPTSAFIAMGNEGNGLSEAMRRMVRFPLTIPPAAPGNHPDSLNVAIATAITLAQFRK